MHKFANELHINGEVRVNRLDHKSCLFLLDSSSKNTPKIYKKVRLKAKFLPIIIIGLCNSDLYMQDIACDFIEKPISFRILSIRIKNLLQILQKVIYYDDFFFPLPLSFFLSEDIMKMKVISLVSKSFIEYVVEIRNGKLLFSQERKCSSINQDCDCALLDMTFYKENVSDIDRITANNAIFIAEKDDISSLDDIVNCLPFPYDILASKAGNNVLDIRIMQAIKRNMILYCCNKKVEKMALFDNLTGLQNQNFFYHYLNYKGLYCTLAIIDIDDMKKINDLYGYMEGDIFLKNVGSIIKKHAKDNIKCFRYGGDEFCIIIYKKSKKFCQKALLEISASIKKLKFKNKRIKFSMGMCYGSSVEETLIELFNKANKAVHKKKLNF